MARAQRRHTEAGKRADQRSTRVLWGGLLAGGLIAAGIALAPGFREPAEETVAPVDITPREPALPAAAPEVEALRVRVVRKYPHAADAFTQGLIWHEDAMYESTGQYGRSSLRKVRLEDGKVLAERKLESRFFGEGLARVDDRLIQLTWRAGLAFVSDLTTLEEHKALSYSGEGWGLCYDGTALVMSDGSSMLELRDPESMALLGEVTVLKNGHPVRKLNELECTGSEVYANIWQSNEILRIDRKSGRVTATIDASGLLSRSEARRADVLNGIAYKPESKTFLLTGKLWPHVFEVELVPR
ncbi:MAG: glutaminyl-peptide cyclotransferase [Deltaproteobacteria bacterium]|nr:glutaminyl-peptide cyclotransferase [Deltaproteobacteria bacterium]MBW2209423.1 glutaminyl-peptide cyclotransferase [Deltaproteobacteria bacterium]MBW2549152.1 glutaminyl-peptide cyclotransferase [Deltaproteobacteria bacterium]MBW2684400.1 glutaminyl-peptide cyclotransferase [Deltaproteobacteria bacterium]